MELDARKQEENLQVLENLARQLASSAAQRRVACDFLEQLREPKGPVGRTGRGSEKENVAPKITRLEASPCLPLRELSPFPHAQNRRAVVVSSIESEEALKVADPPQRSQASALRRQLEEMSRAEQALTLELETKAGDRSDVLLGLKEDLEKEEQLLMELRQAEQLTQHPSRAFATTSCRNAQQAETSLRRISKDLAMELEKQRALQQQVASELKNMESHCCSLVSRLQLQEQMASNLLSDGGPPTTEDAASVCPVEAEVIQLLHAAIACLDVAKLPGCEGGEGGLVPSCSMVRSVVKCFRDELLKLVEDLGGRSRGASCSSMVFSICDALRAQRSPVDACKSPQRRPATRSGSRPKVRGSKCSREDLGSKTQRKQRESLEDLGEDSLAASGGASTQRLVSPASSGEQGAVQSTQRLVSLLQRQEEELRQCLSKLKPPPVAASPQKWSPDAAAYPESLTSTPYAELKRGSPASSPGVKQAAANAQRLQQLLEFRGAAHRPRDPPSHAPSGSVRTEDVPLRALWKEFQACSAQASQASGMEGPCSSKAEAPRLPCMIHLDQQEKNLQQLHRLLHQMPEEQHLAQQKQHLAQHKQSQQKQHLAQQSSLKFGLTEGTSEPGTPPMLGTPSKEATCRQDGGTPSSCLRRARSRLSQLREGLNG